MPSWRLSDEQRCDNGVPNLWGAIMLEGLKKDLPNFPDEVLADWLLPYAESEGWPPREDEDGRLLGRWYYLLGGRPMGFYRSLKWSLEYRKITLEDLAPEELSKVAGMVRGALGERNLYSESIKNLGARFMSIVEYVKDTKMLPKPPTIIGGGDGLQIIDGNHRMAVYFLFTGSLGKPNGHSFWPIESEQPFWIGTV